MIQRLRAVAYRIYFVLSRTTLKAMSSSRETSCRISPKTTMCLMGIPCQAESDRREEDSPGQKLKVIKGPFAAVVDLSDMELTIHSHGHFVALFPVGIGKDIASPVGNFKVADKLRDPTY